MEPEGSLPHSQETLPIFSQVNQVYAPPPLRSLKIHFKYY